MGRHSRPRLVSPSIRQPSYKMADRIEGLRAKHAKKVSGCMWNSTNILLMRTCVWSAQQRLWLARFKVQRETRSSHRAVYRASPSHVAWIPDALERSGVWFRSCLFMCTLLELFVIQSSYLSTLAGRAENVRTKKVSVYPYSVKGPS